MRCAMIRLQSGDGSMGKKIAILAITFAMVAFAQPVYAQQAGKVPRVGVIMTGGPKTHAPVVKWLRQGLR